MFRSYIVDLHVHTCLSACGSSSMIPPKIVASAQLKGLHGIGITDHNSAGNVAAVKSAAGHDIAVFGGMEITTQEEIHLLALFGESEKLMHCQRIVEQHLSGLNDAERFGEQYLVDPEGYIVKTFDAFLSGTVDLSIDEIVDMVHEQGGIAIAAHIDRESFSISSQLGFIPESLPIDAVEISSSNADFDKAGFRELPVIACSDAHAPEQIGMATSVVVCERLTFDELKSAVAGENGRSIRPYNRTQWGAWR